MADKSRLQGADPATEIAGKGAALRREKVLSTPLDWSEVAKYVAVAAASLNSVLARPRC